MVDLESLREWRRKNGRNPENGFAERGRRLSDMGLVIAALGVAMRRGSPHLREAYAQLREDLIQVEAEGIGNQ